MSTAEAGSPVGSPVGWAGSLECEQAKDIWTMSVFGYRGRLDFTTISQPWLREATKRWAVQDLLRRRGPGVVGVLQGHVVALARLSESLWLHRADHGLRIGELGRADVEMFLRRLSYLQQRGETNALFRSMSCRKIYHSMRQMRLLGLARAGGPLCGLSEDFALRREDVPRRPERETPTRALPPEVLAQLCDAVSVLRASVSPTMATAVELLIDTGRRPSEIVHLRWDCVARDHDDNHVLIYHDFKNNRPGRRLPITQVTAELIATQQRATRQRFPHLDPAELLLLPSDQPHTRGDQPLGRHHIGRALRKWFDALPTPPRRADGTSYDLSTITPYSYRHTYAQRHADAGVALDVLAELMGHEVLSSTQAYYHVSEKRRRAAVDRLANHQFDRHGNHLWRQAQTMLEHEHTRHALGQVAVPYGNCREPSNVQAGGGACPFRFRCVGCDHFRTDVSHLPELKTFRHDLLRDRERVLATTDLDGWAKAEAEPSGEEIRRITDLIHRLEHHLDTLTPDEQADIATAVAAVRRTRHITSQPTNLGMPAMNPYPDHHMLPERP